MNRTTPNLPRTPRRTVSLRRARAFALLGLATTGCPEQTSSPSEAKAPCQQIGQRCEFSPGKLGSCVLNDNCQGPNCFICQSQH
jgi:hypothetical protein